jgi:hypothetical protein
MALLLWLQVLWVGVEALLPTALVLLGSAAASNQAAKRKRVDNDDKLKIASRGAVVVPRVPGPCGG